MYVEWPLTEWWRLEESNIADGLRKYLLVGGKGQERMVHVSSLVRLKGLMFSPGPGGPAGSLEVGGWIGKQLSSSTI